MKRQQALVQIHVLSKMLSETQLDDVKRLESIGKKLISIAAFSDAGFYDMEDIIHSVCEKRVEDCDCENPRASAINDIIMDGHTIKCKKKNKCEYPKCKCYPIKR